MAAKTGSSYISGTMTDSIEIPTTSPEMAGSGPNRLYCHFRLSVLVEVVRGQFLRAGRGRKPHSCRWNCHPICHNLNFLVSL